MIHIAIHIGQLVMAHFFAEGLHHSIVKLAKPFIKVLGKKS